MPCSFDSFALFDDNNTLTMFYRLLLMNPFTFLNNYGSKSRDAHYRLYFVYFSSVYIRKKLSEAGSGNYLSGARVRELLLHPPQILYPVVMSEIYKVITNTIPYHIKLVTKLDGKLCISRCWGHLVLYRNQHLLFM